ncbi:hypothetical protein MJ579_10310 [Klebsiella pneumoniae]|nr:hypothetical protein MJ579_10310 [Klebsiella pneumoniae]
MTSELAKRLGVEEQFTEGRTQEGWMRYLYEQSRKAIPRPAGFRHLPSAGASMLCRSARSPRGLQSLP